MKPFKTFEKNIIWRYRNGMIFDHFLPTKQRTEVVEGGRNGAFVEGLHDSKDVVGGPGDDEGQEDGAQRLRRLLILLLLVPLLFLVHQMTSFSIILFVALISNLIIIIYIAVPCVSVLCVIYISLYSIL